MREETSGKFLSFFVKDLKKLMAIPGGPGKAAIPGSVRWLLLVVARALTDLKVQEFAVMVQKDQIGKKKS